MSNSYRVVIQTDRETANGPLFAATNDFSVEERRSISRPAEGLAAAHVIEPVSMTILVTTLGVLAYRVVEHVLRRNEYGVLIDARTTPATISTVAGIPNGFMVVIEANGTTKSINVTAMSENVLTNLLAGIVKSSGKS